MSTKPHPSPNSFLEESLPDLVRQEATQLWTKRWIDQQIESYLVEELIGTGTHGVVFRARRTKPYDRTVAIKLLPNLQGQTKAKRFQNECQALADLEHQSISQILTAGLTEDGTPYLIMPLLSGVPIDDYVAEHKDDWERIADLVRQLASAMAFAHEKGVVHCDLKPDNILVDEDGQVTVTDFGLAVRIDEMDDLTQRPSWAPGTIGYAAPEILTSRKDASPSVDVYSLGAVLYRLLTGEAPHQSTGWLDSLVATVEERLKPVRSCKPSVPAGLAEICDRCLAKDPSDRFASAAVLEAELVSFAESHRTKKNKERHPILYGVVTLAIFVSIVALLVFIWPKPAGDLRGWNESPDVIPDPLSDQQVEWILKGIEEQLLRPGLKVPAEVGEYGKTFETLKDAAKELESLLSHAPTHKRVRHRAATGYFLFGRAALWMNKGDYADRSLARSEQMFRKLNEEFPDEGFMFDVFHTIILQATRAPHSETINLHLRALSVIEDLRETAPKNLDYSDAHACTMVLLAEDYGYQNVDSERAFQYARHAFELAKWTCDQPGSLPLHRKHIMTSTSILSEIARLRGDTNESLELAEIARTEAIRLDEALQVADTKHHRFDKTVKYRLALKNVGGLDDASLLAGKAQSVEDRLMLSSVSLVLDSSFNAASNPGTLGGVAVADFNEDGIMDLASTADGAVSVHLGNGDGTYAARVSYPSPNGNAVTTADFDLDGNIDVVHPDYSGGIRVLLGNGDGTLQSSTAYSGGSGPIQVAVGDYDANGYPDVAAANQLSGNVSIHLNDGTGGFLAPVFHSISGTPVGMVSGDFDNDNDLDLASVNLDGNTFTVLLNQGGGTFAVGSSFSGNGRPFQGAAGDFNRDGNLDVVLANRTSQTITVHSGNGDGTFQDPTTYFLGLQPHVPEVADFNADGILDIAVSTHDDQFTGAVVVLTGKSDGTFVISDTVNGIGGAAYSSTGDLDSDGRLDLAVTGTGAGLISILLNKSVSPTANAGGPYVVPEGGLVTLDGSESTDPNDTIVSYEWDFDYDGVSFDVDAIGSAPVFDATNLDGPDTRTVALRVTDESGLTDIVTTTVTIENLNPAIISLATANSANDFVEIPFSATTMPGTGSFSAEIWINTTDDNTTLFEQYECGGSCPSNGL